MKYIAIFFFASIFISIKTEDADTIKAISKCPEIKPTNNTHVNNVCKGRWFIMKKYAVLSSETLNTCELADFNSTDHSNIFVYNMTSETKGKMNFMSSNVTVDTPGVLQFNDFYVSIQAGEVSSYRSYVKVNPNLIISNSYNNLYFNCF